MKELFKYLKEEKMRKFLEEELDPETELVLLAEFTRAYDWYLDNKGRMPHLLRALVMIGLWEYIKSDIEAFKDKLKEKEITEKAIALRVGERVLELSKEFEDQLTDDMGMKLNNINNLVNQVSQDPSKN